LTPVAASQVTKLNVGNAVITATHIRFIKDKTRQTATQLNCPKRTLALQNGMAMRYIGAVPLFTGI
jgi:hypothetical protein